MSLLSRKDINKELGRNFFIHPFSESKIRGASINLSASKYAWSLKTKKKIFKDNDNKGLGVITIDPNDSALIITQESIYVSSKLAGSFHSKVGMVAKGLGHISTTLDPGWKGNLLITIHNHSSESIELNEGSTFITLILHYVSTPDMFDDNNSAGRLELLRGYDLSPDDIKFIESDVQSTINGIKSEMINSESYKRFNTFRKRKIEFIKPFFNTSIFVLLISLIYWVVNLYRTVPSNVNTVVLATIAAIIATMVSFFFFKNAKK